MKSSAVILSVLVLASSAYAQTRPSTMQPSSMRSPSRRIAPPPPTVSQPAPPPSTSRPSQPPSPFAAGPRTYAPRYTPRYGRPDYPPFYAGAIGGGGSPAASPEAIVPVDESAPFAPPQQAPVMPVVVAPHAPDTYYVIEGCYAGNRPPNPDRLPKGCNAGKAKATPVR